LLLAQQQQQQAQQQVQDFSQQQHQLQQIGCSLKMLLYRLLHQHADHENQRQQQQHLADPQLQLQQYHWSPKTPLNHLQLCAADVPVAAARA
jgi:hypothetical protein